MRTYQCRYDDNLLFFDNTQCLACKREVGWCPACSRIVTLEPLAEGGYRCSEADCGARLLKCHNYAVERVCNRMVEMNDAGEAALFCDCCRYNRVIPDLSIEGHRERWAMLESAKRRLIYLLDLLKLPHGTEEEGIKPPLSFSFMADALPDAGLWRPVGNEKVYTGHANGHITINVKEADDIERERLRIDMNESQRTLIGHFRHEIGHYYWEMLVQGHDEEAFKALFGDHENPSYAEAIERYYAEGAPADWPERYVSAYATMHPWEDFAETFGFYLDIVAVVDTARDMGMTRIHYDTTLDGMLAAFQQIGLAMNEINREMGLLDLVPEVITPKIRDKLAYVDRLVQRREKLAG